jgi:hypothetical protein
MKSNLRFFAVIAFLAVIPFSFSSCTGGGGDKIINSAEALTEYLNSQPGNTPDKPIKVSMIANDLMFKNIAEAIKAADKYVNLDLSRSIITTIPDNAFYDTAAKKGSIALVGIILPKSVTIIGGAAFYGCASLASIAISNSVTRVHTPLLSIAL